MDIAQDFIGGRARLDANVVFLDKLEQVWSHEQAEAVADALRSKQDGIVQFRVAALIGLASVQIDLEAIANPHLGFDYLLQKVINAQIVVFFVYHVEADDHLSFWVGLSIGLNDCVDSPLDVLLSENF
eukprot:CAMPEP_0170473824 /NCGR_PEP_ID=MMETSP0123-20130129/15668_1 /TAXON_ID=182087 /ORGANISM="Favella ehrenbergii, Strain Fehren 1" /LENGTH=127 /DNA_ID=CAMNT_0010743107 /DNA_START=264 /DNA_END=647 /DNA_ORIENTATION=-